MINMKLTYINKYIYIYIYIYIFTNITNIYFVNCIKLYLLEINYIS